MRMTTKTEYSVVALRQMLDLMMEKNANKPIKLSILSNLTGISLHYLEQLFRDLRESNLIKSIRGPGGGYIFNINPAEITFYDIMISVENKVVSFEDRKEFNKVNDKITEILKNINLADIETGFNLIQ
jgi:Rrf2 family iron-sulfur cluster assembly transcriptional regulator